MPPRPVEMKETWGEWWEGWKLWSQQVEMNLWYGRGGLNVKVCIRVSSLVKQNYRSKELIEGVFLSYCPTVNCQSLFILVIVSFQAIHGSYG
jgi:hypothetical protein